MPRNDEPAKKNTGTTCGRLRHSQQGGRQPEDGLQIWVQSEAASEVVVAGPRWSEGPPDPSSDSLKEDRPTAKSKQISSLSLTHHKPNYVLLPSTRSPETFLSLLESNRPPLLNLQDSDSPQRLIWIQSSVVYTCQSWHYVADTPNLCANSSEKTR